MPNPAKYHQQTVTVERRVGIDAYGAPSYSDPEDLKARKEIVQRRVRSREGVEVMASTRVYMTEELQVDDLIDGEYVQDRENTVGKRGNVLQWAYYL